MASLIVTDGPSTGAHFPLKDHALVSIGRDDQCTYQVLDPAVSRQHLQIRRDRSGGFVVADYRSANGVLVNGKSIVGERPLSEGDGIVIGGTRMVFTMADFPDAASAVASIKKDEWKRSTMLRPSNES